VVAGVAQVPFLAEGGPEPSATLIDFIGEHAADPLATVPATTRTPDGVGLLFHDDAHHFFTSVAAERAPAWRDELLIAGFLEVVGWRPIDDVTKSNVPLLVIAATDDKLTPPGPILNLDPRPALLEVVEVPGNHFGVYTDGFSVSSGAAIRFFRRHLGK